MSAVADQWMDADPTTFKPPLSKHPPPRGGHKTHFPNCHYGHKLFEELNTNPKVLRVVAVSESGAGYEKAIIALNFVLVLNLASITGVAAWQAAALAVHAGAHDKGTVGTISTCEASPRRPWFQVSCRFLEPFQ
eukprot:SAG31_NODE_337_length_17493_cov_5.855755_6_plen_134_part_00